MQIIFVFIGIAARNSYIYTINEPNFKSMKNRHLTPKARILDVDCVGSDICFVTNHGNAIIIDGGVDEFKSWCHRHGLAERCVEGESEWCVYPETRDVLIDFVLDNVEAWRLDYDAMGEFYGDWWRHIDAAFTIH